MTQFNPRVYDAGPKSGVDRYTLIDHEGGMHGFNENPYHPQGFGQYVGEYHPSYLKNLGKRTDYTTLPDQAQRFVRDRW